MQAKKFYRLFQQFCWDKYRHSRRILIWFEFQNNSEERKTKQESKQNNNNNSRRTQNGQRQNRYKNIKDRSRSRSSSQKGTNNQGAAKKLHKMIRTKNKLYRRNHDINAATRKISINLENSVVLWNNKKAKQRLMWS